MTDLIKIAIISISLSVSGCLKYGDPNTPNTASVDRMCAFGSSSMSLTPSSSLPLGQTGGALSTEKIAQSFTVNSTTTFATTATLLLKKVKKPAGFLHVSIQKNSGGTPQGVTSLLTDTKKLTGLPSGVVLVGGLIDVSDLPNDDKFHQVNVSMDHGTLDVQAGSKTRRVIASTEETLTLEKGVYWFVVKSTLPLNSTDYVLWASSSSNVINDGFSLALVDTLTKQLWSIGPTGPDRDMTFALGCKN